MYKPHCQEAFNGVSVHSVLSAALRNPDKLRTFVETLLENASTSKNRLVQFHYCQRCTSPPVNLPLQHTSTFFSSIFGRNSSASGLVEHPQPLLTCSGASGGHSLIKPKGKK